MPSLAVFRVLIRELTTRERAPRIPEPMVMDDPQNVDAYARAAVADKVLAPVYLYNAAHVCEVVRPGDHVLDLGCGPATQLATVAALLPDARFVGVDLSEPMLDRGRKLLAERGLPNATLQFGDMTKLSAFDGSSFDAVISTLALHHLPDERALTACLSEVARVLKPGGGLFLLDLGRLRSTQSMHYFAHQYADRQSELFTLDYWHSLRAAFSPGDFLGAGRALEGRGRLYRTFAAPYMYAFKSTRRRADTGGVREALRKEIAKLPACHGGDLRDLGTFFALGGLRSGLL
jgi:ubiquinone/menaquinone biosynthesis C-methylase UbiE